jgi:hypothetical protein
MRGWIETLGLLVRRGLPALALYAMLLQAFLTAASPAAQAGFDPLTSALCGEMQHAPDGSGSGAPHHACICPAFCAQSFHAGDVPQAAPLPATRVSIRLGRAEILSYALPRETRSSSGFRARAPPFG